MHLRASLLARVALAAGQTGPEQGLQLGPRIRSRLLHTHCPLMGKCGRRDSEKACALTHLGLPAERF